MPIKGEREGERDKRELSVLKKIAGLEKIYPIAWLATTYMAINKDR
jgi:hypothetical protein